MRTGVTTIRTELAAVPTSSRPALASSALLRLMRLASPSLPVGGFSYSEGLEAAVEAGSVRDADSASRWLLDQLQLALARSDLAIVAAAIAAWDRADLDAIAGLNDWVSATRETAELRLQAEQMGRSMAEWLRHQEPLESPDPRIARLKSLQPAPTWPIAFALAASAAGAPRHEAMLAFAFAWAENMVQATLKAVPLGQSAAQQVLAALIEAIPTAVERAAALPADDRQAFTPMLAILSAQHETQYSRLFRS